MRDEAALLAAHRIRHSRPGTEDYLVRMATFARLPRRPRRRTFSSCIAICAELARAPTGRSRGAARDCHLYSLTTAELHWHAGASHIQVRCACQLAEKHDFLQLGLSDNRCASDVQLASSRSYCCFGAGSERVARAPSPTSFGIGQRSGVSSRCTRPLAKSARPEPLRCQR